MASRTRFPRASCRNSVIVAGPDAGVLSILVNWSAPSCARVWLSALVRYCEAFPFASQTHSS
ncbi:MAG: hypothetical protein HY815_18310 [Candidatus Riflebacteria bacterium]|nr:hypothetical protein [Candidatus Riflebacteria bacterium]